MDLNQKIALRRAELQKEQAVEDSRRREEARQQAIEKEAERKELEELAAKEAVARIQAIEAQLSGSKSDAPMFPASEQRVSEQAGKKVDAHIQKLALARFTGVQELLCAIFFMSGIWGFFEAWWLGLGLWIAGGIYFSRVVSSYETQIKSELNQRGKE